MLNELKKNKETIESTTITPNEVPKIVDLNQIYTGKKHSFDGSSDKLYAKNP